MSTVVLEVFAIILMIYYAGGAWCSVSRQRRTITERDYRRAEQWRAETQATPPHENALLVSLNMALMDGKEPRSTGDAEKLLSSEEKKA